ncbi:MAG TPA: aromatic amino acid ammonia-lyase, partial [Candidatus Limnocylindrales bacterium]
VRGDRIELSSDAIVRIEASRAIVDRALEGSDLVYGLNTGLGSMRNRRLPNEELVAYQEAIVGSHDGGFGPRLDAELVRAAMAVRVVGITRGGSGASLALARTLVEMLNARVHPAVPAIASVGAADLGHMAAIGQVAVGRGWAELDGERMPGAEALRRAGIEPLHLAPKDGIAMISANGVSIGHGAVIVDRAAQLIDVADVALAVSLEAIGGNPSIVDPVVARAKGIAGQAVSADRIRWLLAGSARCAPGGASSVQDPLSFRVGPQVHGAAREFVGLLGRAVEAELNASDDNPLVDIEAGRLVSNGNFHPMVLALALDAIRPAIAHVGQLSERRMSHLWASLMSAADVLLPSGMWRLTRDTRGILLRYAAATRYSTLRALADPVSLDVGPLDHGVEDHSTNAPETARRTDEALGVLADILAVELMLARAILIDGSSRASLGRGTSAALDLIDAALAGIAPDAPSDEAHAAVRTALLERLVPALAGGAAAVP